MKAIVIYHKFKGNEQIIGISGNVTRAVDFVKTFNAMSDENNKMAYREIEIDEIKLFMKDVNI